MADIAFAGFSVLLAYCLLRAISDPSLAVAMAIGTYVCEQVLGSRLVFLSTHGSAYNILIGGVVTAAFLLAVLRGRLGFPRSTQARAAVAMASVYWLYAAITHLWSPFQDYSDSLRYVPYLVVYVILTPALAASTESNGRTWLSVWGLYGLGLAHVLLTVDPDTVRSASRLAVESSGSGELGNPLSLADGGAVLTLISLALLAWGPGRIALAGDRVVRLLAAAGIAIGLWVTFIASRGETMVVVVLSGVLLGDWLATRAALAPSRTLQGARRKQLLATGALPGPAMAAVPGPRRPQFRTHGLRWKLTVGVVGLVWVGIAIAGYLSFYDEITRFAPRYATDQLRSQGVDLRTDLAVAMLSRQWQDGRSVFFGLGIRAGEAYEGVYPHSVAIQALAETGLVGAAFLLACCACALSTFRRALLATQCDSLARSRIVLLGLVAVYELLVTQKKGNLLDPEFSMWLMICVLVCDAAIVRHIRIGAPRAAAARVNGFVT